LIELELSTMIEGEAEASGNLHSLLAEFEARHGIRVHLIPLSYANGWSEVVKYALYGSGPDVSAVGSTWISNLISMAALRPFTEPELDRLGGPSAFVPALWRCGQAANSSQVWAVPWLADTRLIYYRRDWLQAADLDEATAFESPADLAQTLARLQTHVTIPWVIPTLHSLNTLHYLASWIWSAGGDFVNPRNQEVLFAKPEALQGIQAYFDLQRYLSPSARGLGERETNNAFLEGQAAVTLNGSWMWMDIANRQLMDQVGVAPLFKTPFVGAEHLVIWKHARHVSAVIELIRFLTSRQAQSNHMAYFSLLPTRPDLLSASPFTDDVARQVMGRALKTGRVYPSIPRWGLIEDRLSLALTQIWADILAAPQPEVEALLRRHLEPLANRLNAHLG
jgi:multiple sugar transport system substrate-binding protein